MIQKVIKRDGRKAKFNINKIITASREAFHSVGQDYPESFTEVLTKEFSGIDKETVNIDAVQDTVERLLMENGYTDTAKSYILYRKERDTVRDRKNKILAGMRSKLSGKNVINQNANLDEKTFSGRMGEATRVAMKELALEEYMSKQSRDNHLNNEIYIHDLDSYAAGMHNCLSIPFDDILSKGFKVKQTDIRPAGSIDTAFQLIAVVFQLQSLVQFGGVSATHLDWTMVPYVRKSFYKHYKDGIKWLGGNITGSSETPIDNDAYKANKKAYDYALEMTKKETHQGAEALFHNLNSLCSRSGAQLPFSSINFGTCTLPEGRMVIEALLDICQIGLGKFGRTSIFPCSIFQCMKGVNQEKGDPNYDLFRKALRCTAQRLYPNYANCDWSGNAGYDKNNPLTYYSTMGCRTANGFDINGLGQQKDGRGNICPVTVILPTLAAEVVYDKKSKNPVEDFMKLLDKKIGEAKDMLIERFNWICSQSPESAPFMYENNTMAGYDGKNISSALKHGTLALGQLGLAECLQILIGKDHTTPEGMELAKRIEGLFKQRCAEYKEQYKLNFGVYYTPAENLCFTAMTKFRKKYGEIPGVSDRKYFTNSMHVPVWKEMSPFKKIDIESQLTGYSSAGCITYVELPSSIINNIDGLETLVKYAMDKDIPYFAVNVPNDMCMDCGWQGDIKDDACPKCGSKNIQRLRRVTGYLSTDYHNFNEGKIAEVEDRVKHIDSKCDIQE